MRTTRAFVDLPLAAGEELLLPPGPSAHLLRVLRLREGAALTLFNGQGGEYAAQLLGDVKSRARVRVGAHDAVERESPLQVTLLQGVARGERMDFILQKATELGVAAIVPVACEHSVVRVDGDGAARKQERWQQVAIAACEQSGRNRVPAVSAPLPLEAAWAHAQGLKVTLAPGAPESLATACARPLEAATLLVGPEGGLSDREVSLAQRAGFIACRLGPRVLRTETAPLAALALLQALAGDLAR